MTSDTDLPRILLKRLERIEKKLQEITKDVDSKTEGSLDSCVLRQYETQLNAIQTELENVAQDIMTVMDEDDALTTRELKMSRIVFDTSVKIKRLLQGTSRSSTSTSDGRSAVKLPKLEVPKFDGNIIHWQSFWERFTVSVHDQSILSTAEKLTYLKHAVKDGSAKYAVEGLSNSGDQYSEAVDCLKEQYNRPHLIHQAHIRAILEAPALKCGSGRELRVLHDTINQHLRALKSMDSDPSGRFITSMLELKLDPATMFEWQKCSQDSVEVPYYSLFLEFLNLRAQAAESTLPETKHQHEGNSGRKSQGNRYFTSFAAHEQDNCVVCKSEKHPLYACSKFKAMSQERMKTTIKNHELCMNCLKPGHFVRQCPSTHKCRKCQKPHHTLLHIDEKLPDPQGRGANSTEPLNSIVSHISQAVVKSHVLLMTCRVQVVTVDGSSTPASLTPDRPLHLSRSDWRSAYVYLGHLITHKLLALGTFPTSLQISLLFDSRSHPYGLPKEFLMLKL
jgi:hypothetical protein